MRKRFWKILCGPVLAAVLTACAGASDPGSQTAQPDPAEVMTDGPGSEQTPEQAGPDQAGQDQTPAGDQTDGGAQTDPDTQQTAQPVLQEIDPDARYTLGSQFGSERVYVVDGYGSVQESFDLTELAARLLEKGVNSESWFFRGMMDGICYYTSYEELGEGYGYRLYAVDPEDLQVQTVWTCDDGWWLDTVDLYNGKGYIVSSGDGFQSKETEFVKNPGSLTFSLKSSGLEAFLNASQGYYRQNYDASTGSYNSCSYTRLFDLAGYVVASKDDHLYSFDRSGAQTSLRAVDALKATVRGYDDAYIICCTYDEKTYTESAYYCYRVESSSSSVIPLPEENMSFLAYADGALYLCGSSEKAYNQATHRVYRYDCAAEEMTLLYEETAVPGTQIQPGTESFRLLAGQPCFVGFEKDRLVWCLEQGAGADARVIRTECTLRSLPAFRLGKVICDSREVLCPYCQTPMEETYEECFVLDDAQSPHADLINKTLYEHMQASIGEENGWMPESDEYCEDHKEYPTQWCTTTDGYVQSAEILDSRILTVEMTGYIYSGGAHGYPTRGQMVFDLETGEQLTIRDFYTGTEEDFRKLVAEKTREDYSGYDWEYNPYFAEDENAVYSQAYDYAGFDTTQIEFMEDGAIIVYSPYEMGAYASGYIDVFIPYEELLGRSTLTEG